ncbi:MAG: helix-turn-helix transcriptional regulator [Pirellulales bacterium]|nr:helix-turn-helix transcriptional regulator [Pirellulales bacterium]
MATTRKKNPPACPCLGGTLDKLLHPAILVVLSRGPLHGYRIAQEIGGMPLLGGHAPDVSGIYRFLKHMEQEDFVVSTWDTSTCGPAKKAYEITPEGRRCLRQWIDTLAGYRDGISHLLRSARKAAERA